MYYTFSLLHTLTYRADHICIQVMYRDHCVVRSPRCAAGAGNAVQSKLRLSPRYQDNCQDTPQRVQGKTTLPWPKHYSVMLQSFDLE